MKLETAPAAEPLGAAVLLHPHPDFGGDSRHPFVAGLFSALPARRVTAVRFDFSSSDTAAAAAQALEAVRAAQEAAGGRPVVVAGYSFGAGIASRIADEAVAAWYLLAPQVAMIAGSGLALDPRPKLVAVPERDQFSPPPAIGPALGDWSATEVTVLAGVDHFLGDVSAIVASAAEWLAARLAPGAG